MVLVYHERVVEHGATPPQARRLDIDKYGFTPSRASCDHNTIFIKFSSKYSKYRLYIYDKNREIF